MIVSREYRKRFAALKKRLAGSAVPLAQAWVPVPGNQVRWTDRQGRNRTGRLLKIGTLVAWVREKGQRGRARAELPGEAMNGETEYNPMDHTSVSLADCELMPAVGATAGTERMGTKAATGPAVTAPGTARGDAGGVPGPDTRAGGTAGGTNGQTRPGPEGVTSGRDRKHPAPGAGAGTEPKPRQGKGKAMMKQVERTCANCGKTFQGAIVAKFCKDPECVKAVKKAWSDKYLAKRRNRDFEQGKAEGAVPLMPAAVPTVPVSAPFPAPMGMLAKIDRLIAEWEARISVARQIRAELEQ